MAACDNLIGIKVITIRFTDCETGAVYGPFSHKQANEELPKWRLVDFINEEQPGGFIKRTQRSMKGSISLNRLLFLPLRFYQGAASMEVQVEYINGIVITAVDAAVAGEEMSDTREVTMDLIAPVIEELLPPGGVVA